jgi:DNA-binding transcriptional regulator YdaS (Cro superfamily)
MDISNIRRNNLLALIRAAGSLTALSTMTGVSAAYLSQVKTGFREMGSKLARKIEAALNLPNGVIDTAQEWDGFSPSPRPSLHSSDGIDSDGEDEASLPRRQSKWDHVQQDTFVRVELFRSDDERDGGYFTGAASPVRSIEFSSTLLQNVASTAKLDAIRLLVVDDFSMSPTMEVMDVLLLDTSVNSIATDGIYLFRFGKSVHLKRLQRMGAKIAVKSDNQKYDTWHIEESEEQAVTVLGRACARLPLSLVDRLG